jgi:hypothetical protein
MLGLASVKWINNMFETHFGIELLLICLNVIDFIQQSIPNAHFTSQGMTTRTGVIITFLN